jgi:hypothetical protein
MSDRRDGLTSEERAAIERVTRRAGQAHDRFVRELDGLLYDLHEYTARQRADRPPERPPEERSERP